MRERIIGYLGDIELEFKVKILLACETGSRAWGFPSPDSDFDVRLIFTHQMEWYLSLNERRDTIERMLDDNEIDISGWDLRKSLRLLSKSNAALLERIQSSIIYKCDEAFMKEINLIAPSFYSRIATIHHYLSLTKNVFHEISIGEPFKLKKLFYALRSAIACYWIMEKDTMPPIYFPTMLEELNFQPGIRERIYELIEFKSNKDESYLHQGETELFDLISGLINESELKANGLPPGNGSMERMNDFFIRNIR